MSKDADNRTGLINAISRLWRRPPPAVEETDERDHVTTFLAALQEMSARMKADVPLPDLMATLAEQSSLAVAADLAIIRLLDENNQGLIVNGVHGIAQHRVAGLLGSFSVVTDVFRSLWPGSLAAFDLRAGLPPLMTPAEYTEMQELGTTHLLILPLHHRGRLVGRLDLGRQWDDPFTVDDRAAATVLAGLLASAVCDPTNRSETEKTEILEASFTFQRSIEPLSNVSETLQSVVESIRGIVGCDRSFGLLWQEPKREFTPVAVSGAEPALVDTLKSITFSPAAIPALTQAINSPEPVVIADVDTSQLLPPSVTKPLGTQSAVIVALRGREGRLLGALMLDFLRPDHHISEQDITIVANIAAHASVVVENAMLYEDLKRSSESLALVNEIGLDLASLTDLTTLFSQVFLHISTVIEAPRFCIGLLLPDEKSLEYRYAINDQVSDQPVVVPLGDDPLSWVVRTKRRILSNTRHPQDKTNWFPPAPTLPPAQSMMAVPLVVGRRVIGVMSTQTDARGAYADYQLELLTTIGMQTGVAIENARLYAMVQERGQLRAYLLDKMISKQEAERKMLVDDIHNDTLQTLASCLFQIDLTARQVTQLEPEQTEQALLQVRDNLAENIARLRRLIFKIRPSTLDILGLEAALQEYFSQLEKDIGIQATLDVDLPDRLPSELETIVYRMIQEAIDHVRMRNGASRIVVRVRQRHETVVVTIADDGHGLDPTTLANGALVHAGISDAKMSLLTLKERAELAGGQIRMANRPSGGSTLQILLPYRSE